MTTRSIVLAVSLVAGIGFVGCGAPDDDANDGEIGLVDGSGNNTAGNNQTSDTTMNDTSMDPDDMGGTTPVDEDMPPDMDPPDEDMPPVVPPGGLDLTDLPSEEWSWLDVPGMKCGNGDATGIGINYSPDAKNLAIFLVGGGACWDNLTCYVLNTATNLQSGFGEDDFLGELDRVDSIALFDRDAVDNPAADYTYVVVPYCTGDVHAGSTITEHGGRPTQHVGYSNVTAVLDAVAPSYKDADRVILTGASAGGYGAAFNLRQVQDNFPGVRVDVINDSGPPIRKADLESQWRAAWGLDALIPEDCPEACDDRLDAVLRHVIERDPNARFALLSYTQDRVISTFYLYGPMQFEMGLNDLRTSVFDPIDHAKVFFTPGNSHTFYGNMKNVSQNETTVWEFVKLMLNDDPTWGDVTP